VISFFNLRLTCLRQEEPRTEDHKNQIKSLKKKSIINFQSHQLYLSKRERFDTGCKLELVWVLILNLGFFWFL